MLMDLKTNNFYPMIKNNSEGLNQILDREVRGTCPTYENYDEFIKEAFKPIKKATLRHIAVGKNFLEFIHDSKGDFQFYMWLKNKDVGIITGKEGEEYLKTFLNNYRRKQQLLLCERNERS